MSQSPQTTHRLVDLREVTDAAVAGGFSDSMEARFAREPLGCERIGISLQRIKPGRRGAFGHRHATDEEVYVVVAGAGRAVVDGEVLELRPWHALRVPASSTRASEAGEPGLEILAFGTHTENDAEIVEAGWPE